MAELVRTNGEALPEDDLSASDVVIPPSDLTLEETRRLFSDDGLIPDLPRRLTDPRVEAYARLLVERCVDVQPGWQVARVLGGTSRGRSWSR